MINFPSNPSLNDTFNTGDVTYIFDGVKWSVTNASTFEELDDTPAYLGNAGKAVAVKSDEAGVEYVPFPESGGAESFSELNDTPAYAG
ncbi:MAG: hypothetical protein LC687_05345, partial [Actinobacteria bacterium]|nr:hypothetical protein [Actinomycetota bacterium]